MSKKRQDSWTSDEDVILVETVLRYIRDGKTQLEAFKEAGKKLSRTAAACGFRWNATLRKKHLDDINVAKQTKRHHLTEIANNSVAIEEQTGEVSIEKAISLLKKLKEQSIQDSFVQTLQNEIEKLQRENEYLKKQLSRYNEAWQEMHHIWNWIENKNEHL